jgi:predicted RNA-binding Zn-ribbon protein involved in translation (DUF1610 family)
VVIFKEHLREYHRKGTDWVQDQPKNDTVVKSYICQKCTFETYSVLMWIKHLNGSCFNTKEECQNVSEEEWYPSESCFFRTKETTVLEKHQAAKQSRHHFRWYSCHKCEFKTKWNVSLKLHERMHLSADAIQWYNCDKCEFRGSRGNGGPLSTFAHKICIIVQIVSKKNQQITENILFNIIY